VLQIIASEALTLGQARPADVRTVTLTLRTLAVGSIVRAATASPGTGPGLAAERQQPGSAVLAVAVALLVVVAQRQPVLGP
jgi:hypothetical protein